MQTIEQIAEAIKDARTVLVASHIRGDGDSLGSVLGLALPLRKAGKKVFVCIDTQVPDIYKFLPGLRLLVPPLRMKIPCDLGIALDTPTLKRLGAVEPLFSRCARGVNIDHHRTNVRFAQINWVDAKASSVGEMVYHLLGRLGLPVGEDAAENLYTAILTDTGRFTYENTTPASMRIAADLIERGVDFAQVGRHVYQSTTREVFALRALAMETIHFEVGGRVGIMMTTRAMFKKAGARPINTQDFVDIPRSIKGVSVAALIQDMEKAGWVKVSLRSDRSLESDKVAAVFGGGGHARAAGCEIQGTIQEARKRVLAEIKARLKAS